MNEINFAGKDGFTWWVGEVVDRIDPLDAGRYKVRIFGWHGDGGNESVMKIPEKDLPWAQTILPVTGRNSNMNIRMGDWVLGFFLDGMSAQAPCILGIFNGLNAQTTGVADTTRNS